MPPTTNTTPELVSLPGSYEERYAEAHQHYRRGEFEPAAAICRRIIDRISRLPERRRPPDSPLDRVLLGAHILLAKIHARQGDWAGVDDLCLRGQHAHPSLADRWRIEPFLLRAAHGRAAEGMQGVQALAESEPDKLYFWTILAETGLAQNDLAVAERALDHALALPDSADDPQQLAGLYALRFQVLRERGQWSAAAAAFETSCRLDEETEYLRETVVRMFLREGLWDDALLHVEGPGMGPASAQYYRAWIANQRGDQVRARYLWRNLVDRASDPAGEDITVLRAMSFCWLDQPDAALAVMLEAQSQGPFEDSSEATALALAWAMHGDVDAARANLQLASQLYASEIAPDRPLPGLNWVDFEQLVQDEAVKAELRPFFEPERAVP